MNHSLVGTGTVRVMSRDIEPRRNSFRQLTLSALLIVANALADLSNEPWSRAVELILWMLLLRDVARALSTLALRGDRDPD